MNLVSTSTNIPLFIDVLVDICARSTPSPVHEHLVVLISMLAIACKGEMFTYLRAKLFCDHFMCIIRSLRHMGLHYMKTHFHIYLILSCGFFRLEDYNSHKSRGSSRKGRG